MAIQLIDAGNIDFTTLARRDILLRDCYDNDIFQRGKMSVMGGTGGAGKSVITLQMAVALASGKRFGLWKPTQRYHVVMLNAEDTADEMGERLDAALRSPDAYDIKQTDFAGHLHFVDAPNAKTLLEKKSKVASKITLTDFYTELGGKLKALKADIVFYDPLVELTEGVNENDNSEMSAALKVMRETSARLNMHTCLVHHFRKGAGADNAGSVRGAGSIVALARFNINVEVMNELDAKHFQIPDAERFSYIKLVVAKNNHGPTGSTHWLKADPQVTANGSTTIAFVQTELKSRTKATATPDMAAKVLKLAKGKWLSRKALKDLFQEQGMGARDADALIHGLEMDGCIREIDHKDAYRNKRPKIEVLRMPLAADSSWLHDAGPGANDNMGVAA